MSLTADQIVEYLEREGALATPTESPWPAVDEGEMVEAVEWLELFPRSRPFQDGAPWDLFGDQWSPDLPDGFLSELDWRVGRGADGLGDEAPRRTPDVCAWYQPLHFHGLDWGIYIREDCLLKVALDIGAFLPRLGGGYVGGASLAKALIRAALATLFLHEAYHHKTESLGIRLHIVERRSCYVPYFKNVYNPLRIAASDDLHEEALANADSYRRTPERAHSRWLPDPVLAATRKYLKWRFPLDPPGYRQASRYLTEPRFDHLEYVLKSQVQEGTPRPYRSAPDWQLAPRINQSLFTCTSDIWTIVARGARSILPTSPPYPVISTADLTKALTRSGYTRVKGGKGSHLKLTAPGRPTLILPGDRRELSPVVVRNVAKALGFRNADDLKVALGL